MSKENETTPELASAQASAPPSSNDSKITYISMPLLSLSADRELPGNLYLCLSHRLVKYRNKADKLSADAFNKMVYSHVKTVFVEETDRDAYRQWIEANAKEDEVVPEKVGNKKEAGPIIEAVGLQRRAMMDIFESPKDDRTVKAAIGTSKQMVSEMLRKPFAVNNIQALQKYSKGAVDHSVNVSILSVFLGLRLGYSHQVILENLALGGLFHDIGKSMVQSTGSDSDFSMSGEDDPAMQQHPKLAADFLDQKRDFPNEVRMIVAQHHEFLDGTGYPAKLRGLAIYDLARIVTIANIYDNLISTSLGETMKDKAAEAIGALERDYEGKLDPKKLEKVVKVLRYSFL
jgi:putative nucleotidyltransferase with HDIG domain